MFSIVAHYIPNIYQTSNVNNKNRFETQLDQPISSIIVYLRLLY